MGYCNAESVEEEIYNLEKEIMQLKEKLNKAKESLEVIATHTIIPDAPEDLKQQVCTVYNIAESALEEIAK